MCLETMLSDLTALWVTVTVAVVVKFIYTAPLKTKLPSDYHGGKGENI